MTTNELKLQIKYCGVKQNVNKILKTIKLEQGLIKDKNSELNT